MQTVLGVLVATYLIGMVVSAFVYPSRAGLHVSAWIGAFIWPGRFRSGIPWFLLSYAKLIAWPAVFAVWLSNGRPESRILFGPLAAERLLGDASKTSPGFLTKWTPKASRSAS